MCDIIDNNIVLETNKIYDRTENNIVLETNKIYTNKLAL